MGRGKKVATSEISMEQSVMTFKCFAAALPQQWQIRLKLLLLKLAEK